MTTEKKNQHYIPKFYLRNFSYNGNGSQIGVYNINNRLFIPSAKLKTQGSKNFFYGYDGVVEDHLSNIEGGFATLLRKIISTKKLPILYTFEHFDLLFFAALTDSRNPIKIEGFKMHMQQMRDSILDDFPEANIDEIMGSLSHDDIVKMHISGAKGMSFLMLDLQYKLLINKTANPFLSSDFPVIKYNQFLEMKRWPMSKSGYGVTGFQMFIPINHELCIMFYDSSIYKVGDNTKLYHNILNEKNVDDINVLQFLNCFETIYFDEKASENYMRRLHNISKNYAKANVRSTDQAFLFSNDEEDNKKLMEEGFKNLMILKSSDCMTSLKIDGIKIHSKGQKHKLHESMAQLRPHALKHKDNLP